jgi:SIR2-like domain/NACHT domain
LAITNVQRNLDARARLVEALRTERMFSLTGAGLSVYAGYQSWEGFLHKLSERVRQRAGDFVNVDRINEQIANPLWRARQLVTHLGAEFGDFFRSEFGPRNVRPDPVLFSFASLPLRHHLTLNFDPSLVTTYLIRQEQCGALSSARVNDLVGFLRRLDDPRYMRQIVHLHGRFDDDVNRIVLTEDGYTALYANNPMRRHFLWTLFATRRLLFTGFGYMDEDFLRVLEECCRHTRTTEENLTHFAIVGLRPEKNDEQRRYELAQRYHTDAVFYNVQMREEGGTDHREFGELITGLAAEFGADEALADLIAEGSDKPVQEVPTGVIPVDPEDEHIAVETTERLLRSIGRGGGATMIEIRREALLEKLIATGDKSSVLITGSPGIGKSWLLSEYLQDLRKAQRFVLGFAAEEHQASTLSELYKSIGLKTTIPRLLSGRSNPGVLVIDGLDALRSEPAQRVLRDLILEVFTEAPDARIIATIRSFDLRESPTFSKLRGYSSTAGSFAEIKVDLLSDSELEQVFSKSPSFGTFWKSASRLTKGLLRNPFNLQIALSLLEQGADSASLTSVTSQVELLDRYWYKRLESASNGRAMRSLLKSVVEKMIAAKLLSISELEISSDDELPLRDLLSLEFLQRTATGRISFAHNIFFDYAMARAYLDEVMLVPFLNADPSRVLYYRPSLQFFFARLWLVSQSTFWQLTDALYLDASINASARIIPAVVVAELARDVESLKPLTDDSIPNRAVVLRDVLNAIQVLGLGSRRSLWLGFLQQIGDRPPLEAINEILNLISVATSSSSSDEQASLGPIARAISEWSWNPTTGIPDAQRENLSGAVTSRLMGASVADVGEHRDEVRRFVRQILERIGKPQTGTIEIVRLVHEMPTLAASDPELAAEIFERLYGYNETSEAITTLGSGAVMQLSSTRKQDYSTARYGAATSFGVILKSSPILAAGIATRAVNAEVLEARPLNENRSFEAFSFTVKEQEFSYIADYSEIWGDSGGVHYTSLSLLQSCLQNVLERADLMRGEMIKAILADASVGMVWRRLLQTAAQHPKELYAHLGFLLASSNFIAAPEITIDVGRLLESASKAGLIDKQEFSRIEEAILAVTDDCMILRYESADRLKKRLLRSVGRNAISTREALALADSADEVHGNDPFFEMSGGAISERQAMRLRGIDPDATPNRELLEALQPVEDFTHKYMNREIEHDDIAEMLSPIENLRIAIANAEAEGVTEELQIRARGSLIAAAGTVFRGKNLEAHATLVSICRDIVVAGASDSYPEFDAKFHLPFDHPSWGSPSPRIDAAQAIGGLIWNHHFDRELAFIFERLGKDKVPAVRFQIARSLPGIFNRPEHREEFWRILGEMIELEQTTGVLIGLLSSLRMVAGHAPERTIELLSRMLDNGLLESSGSEVMQLTIDMLVGLYIARDIEAALPQIRRFESDVPRYEMELSQCVLVAFQYVSPSTTQERDACARAIKILHDVYDAAYAYARDEQATQKDLAPPAKILDMLGSRLYFIFDLMDRRGLDKKALTDEEREVLYGDLRELISKVSQTGEKDAVIPLRAGTAHYFLKLLNGILWIDPESSIMNAYAICRHGERTGLLIDSLGRGEAVKLIEQAFADHREVLRKPEVSEAVAGLLDLFIRAGWSEAIGLTFRLDEAFR